MERHATYFIDDVTPVEFCGKTIGWQLGVVGGYEVPFETQATSGEHDYTKCPTCQKNLDTITERLKIKLNGDGAKKKGFPHCCVHHSNLVKQEIFNRNAFLNVPEMTAKKVVFTTQHIINNQSSEDWYKKVTDYIAWTVDSFGQMPKGCGGSLFLGDYLVYVADLLKKNKEITPGKKERILEYLDSYQTPAKTAKTDLNILAGVYQKWLKIFPFEISYFRGIRQHFETNLPIINGAPEVNIYSGIPRVKLHTKSSLIEALLCLTNDLLTKINGLIQYQKGLLTDANKIKLELVIQEREMKLKKGYRNDSPNEEHRYRKMLKDWFQDEKKFIDEITPLLKVTPPQQTISKTDKLKETLGKFGFFTLPKVESLSEESQMKLVERLGTGKLPYQIAMIEYLGFIEHLEKEYFPTKYKLNKEVSKWFGSDKDGRAVKANIASLSNRSKENKSRYTAHLHKEEVQKDLEALK